MAAYVGNSPQASAAPLLFDASMKLRVTIPADLAGFEKMVAGHNDHLSTEISAWVGRFKASLRKPHLETVLKEHIESLYGILKDPFGIPLDEKAVLCSDGETYGYIWLTIHLNPSEADLKQSPLNFRSRSPADPTDEALFKVGKTHPLVAHMIAWIKKHARYELPVDLVHKYNYLMNQKETFKIEDLPSQDPVKERHRRLKAEKKEKEEKTAAIFNKIEEPFNRLAANVNQVAQVIQRVDEEAAVENNVQLENAQRSLAARVEVLHEEIEEEEEKVNKCAASTAKLEEGNKNVQDGLADLRARDLELKRLQLERKKRKKKRLKKLIKTVVKVAVCILVAYATDGAVTPTDSGVSLTFLFG